MLRLLLISKRLESSETSKKFEVKNIAGMSMKGGRKDNFFFSLLEYFPESQRWFLKSLLQVKDEKGIDGDEVIRSWIEEYNLKKLVVDFPLSTPECHTCQLDCPGAQKCPQNSVKAVREFTHNLLNSDKKNYSRHPKKYERQRNEDDEFDFSKNILKKESHEHLLSRSFKRRLNTGFLAYWNRSIDFWIWCYYYDQILEFFNTTYDSFGNTSLMLISRFSYLRRHFPKDIDLFEANVPLTLIELFRSKVILKKDLVHLFDMDLMAEARLDIIQKIEKKLNIFIYDSDLEILVKNVRAFESFILAVCGQNLYLNKSQELPDWTLPQKTKFIVPTF